MWVINVEKKGDNEWTRDMNSQCIKKGEISKKLEQEIRNKRGLLFKRWM